MTREGRYIGNDREEILHLIIFPDNTFGVLRHLLKSFS